MSYVPNNAPGVPGLDPSMQAGPLARRYALGLPSGSVRALLALLIVGLLCTLMLTASADRPIPLPAYLLYLLFLCLGHFFAAHGTTIHKGGAGQPPPLHLPSGSLRLLIMAGLIATVVYKLTQGSDVLAQQLKGSILEIQEQPFLPLIIIGGFFLGIVLHVLVGRENTPFWFEDVEAWVALLAVIGLAVDAVIYLVINPTLKDPLTTYDLQGFIAAVIAFYFGARS